MKLHSLFRKICFHSKLSRLPVLILIIAIDSLYFGSLTFTFWNALNFNVIEGQSANYGIESSFSYLTSKLPYLLNLMYPFAIIAFVADIISHLNKRESDRFPILSSMIFMHIFILSLIPHKEARFCLTIMPLLFI